MAATARFAVDNPRVVLLGVLLAVVYGGLSFLALPRQENPSLNERYASVEVYLPGAEPEKVELLITQVIEEAVAEVDDIEDIFSISSHGGSFVMVEIEPEAPVSERLQQVRDKIQEARASFPEGATEPAVDTRVFRTNTMVLALLGEGVSGVALREQAQELERSLENLAMVRRVEVRGLPEEEIEVAIDLPRLAQRGIAFDRVVTALAERNVKLPSGELDVGVVRSPIQTSGAFDVVEQVGQTYLGASAEGMPVRLADVASVRRQLAEPDVKVRSGERKGVALGVEMLPGRNAIRFGERIRAHIESYRTSMPDGMEVRIVADEPTYVDKRLRLLMTGLLFGLFLVVVLTLFGMGWRSGAVVSTTIPLAITAAMGVQDILGVPLHQISIAAVVIAIGIVVDESIVVTDNIQRHLDEGRPPREAAIRGLGEIHMAVLAGAGTTVAAFIPLMLMEGDIGDFIRSIPIVVSAMLGASVLVAHFVTPLLCKLAHEKLPAARERRPLAGQLEPLYRPLLHFVTERRGVVLAASAVGVFVVTAASLSVLLPPTFFPDADRNQFLIKVFLPSGAPLRETEAAMTRMDEILGEESELQDWTLFIGSAAPKFYYNELEEGRGENQGQIVVNTLPSVPFHRIRELVARVDQRLEDEIPGAFIRTHALRQGYGGGDDIRVFILGDDLTVLRALSQEVRSIVAQVPGIEGARDSFGYDPITIQAKVHDATANLLGISHLDIATALHAGIEGVRASTLRENDDEIAIRVRLDSERRRDIHELEELPIWSPRGQKTVPLAQVASLEPGFSTLRVMRYNRKREASVNAGLSAGESLLAVAAQVESSVRERVRLPAGYEFFFAGQQEEVTESFLSLAKATVSAVFLIYIILVLRFQSLAQPGLILLAIPMAIAGSCLGLAITGTDMAFMSFLGMISLAGIAVNDSIVLIDTINRLRREGTALLEAVRQAARLRLRAVLLTSITTIGGLIPLSLSGGEFWQPFGFAMIFGLGASTILTLLIQPAAYMALEGRRDRKLPLGSGLGPEPN